MTPAVLVLNLSSCLTALATLCMSMGRHQGEVFGARQSPRRSLLLRAAGWIVLALSFSSALAVDGVAFGPLHWFGAFLAGALLTVFLLSYRPRWVVSTCLVALAATFAAGIAAWLS